MCYFHQRWAKIRPLAKLNYKRIRGRPADGREGWGREKLFSQRCNRRDGKRE